MPDVKIFYAYTNAPGWVIDHAVKPHVRGIVMDGYGVGVINNEERAAVAKAQAKGVIVVMTWRVGSGRIQETQDRASSHIIAGDNLPPEKARLLLQLALTRTQDPLQIRQFFDSY